MSESLNCALLDSGCSSTVCGKNWLQCYTDTLPDGVDPQEKSSGKSSRFGPGRSFVSLKQINIPVNIGDVQARILTDVVDCEIPLLLSSPTLKAANSQIDFVNDTIHMYGRDIPLQHTSNGHYCIPLTSKQVDVSYPEPILQKLQTLHLQLPTLKTRTEKRNVQSQQNCTSNFGILLIVES